MRFRTLNPMAAIVLFALGTALSFLPGMLYALFGLELNPLGGFVSRRTALFMFGLGVLLVLTAQTRDHATIRAVSVAMVITMGGLAILGLGEFLRGYAGPGIFVAILTETVFAIGYARILIRR